MKNFRRSLARHVILSGVVMVMLVVALFIYDTRETRQLVESRGQSALAMSLMAFTEHVDNDVQAIDLVLRQIQTEYRRGEWIVRNREVAGARLNDMRAGVPSIANINLINRDGSLAASILAPPPGTQYADRDYFRITREAGALRTIISEPFKGRIIGRPVITFSRALFAASGEFAGIISAVVELRYFDRHLQAMGIDTSSLILQLLRSDGRVLYRQGPAQIPDEPPLGRIISSFEGHRLRDLTAVHSLNDDLGWYHSRRVLPNAELEVYASQSDDVLLASWHTALKVNSILFAAVVIFIILATIGINKSLRRLIKVEDDLNEANQRTRLAIAGSRTAIWEWDRQDDSLHWESGAEALFANFLPGDWDGFRLQVFEAERELMERMVKVQLDELGSAECEFRLVRPDGQKIWVLLRGQVVGGGKRAVGILQDISLRYQIEQQSVQKAKRQELALRTGRVGTWSWQADDDRLVWDRRMEDMIGGPLDTLDCLWQAVHPEDRAWVRGSYLQSVASGAWQASFRLTARPGQVAHVSAACLFEWEDGRHVATSGTLIDISTVYRAEQTAREERDRARLYLDTADVMMVALDLKGKVVLANRKACELLERDEVDVLGKDWFGLALPAERADSTRSFYTQAMAGDWTMIPRRVEAEVVSARDTRRWIEWHAKIYRDSSGEPIGILSSGADITERREAQAALQAYQESLEQRVVERTAELADEIEIRRRFEIELRRQAMVVERASAMIVILDREFRIQWANQSFSRQTGFAVANVAGTYLCDVIGPECDTAVMVDMRSRARAGEIVILDEVHRVRRDGSAYWARFELQPVRNPEGEIIEYFGIDEDISALIAARQSMAEAKHAAELLAEAKMRFVANMSHELRTPMNAIIGLAGMLDRELARESGADQGRMLLGKLRHAGDTLLALINDILDLSKLEAHGMRIEQVSFDLRHVLDHCVELVMPRALEKGVPLVNTQDPGLPQLLMGDPLRVGQIVTNLLSNAVKFTQQGQITLDARVIETAPGPAAGRMIEVSVRDTGIGIPEHALQHIFEPFVQADSSTTRQFGGTGLGLSIAHRFAGLMGGDLTVESRSGEGSVFCLRWPLVDAPAGSVPTELQQVNFGNPAALSGLHVLVAEDIEVNQMVVQDLLEQYGAMVRLAENGVELLEMLVEDEAVDVILMDVQMPEMDGIEATRRIRNDPRFVAHARVPIFALTAHAFVEERDRCLAAGMDGHLSKPVEPERILAALAGVPRRSGVALAKADIPSKVGAGETAPVDAPVAAANGTPLIPGLDTGPALDRMSGKLDLYRRSLQSFLKYRAHGESMTRALADADRVAVAKLAHGLKGMAATVGALELATAAGRVESLCRGGDPAADVTGPVRECCDILTTVVQAVEVWLAQGSPAAPTPAVTDETAASEATLARLRELIRQRDADAIRLADRLPAAYAEVSAALKRFDFAAAEAALENGR